MNGYIDKAETCLDELAWSGLELARYIRMIEMAADGKDYIDDGNDRNYKAL